MAKFHKSIKIFFTIDNFMLVSASMTKKEENKWPLDVDAEWSFGFAR
jgi:hypothetical protein